MWQGFIVGLKVGGRTGTGWESSSSLAVVCLNLLRVKVKVGMPVTSGVGESLERGTLWLARSMRVGEGVDWGRELMDGVREVSPSPPFLRMLRLGGTRLSVSMKSFSSMNGLMESALCCRLVCERVFLACPPGSSYVEVDGASPALPFRPIMSNSTPSTMLVSPKCSISSGSIGAWPSAVSNDERGGNSSSNLSLNAVSLPARCLTDVLVGWIAEPIAVDFVICAVAERLLYLSSRYCDGETFREDFPPEDLDLRSGGGGVVLRSSRSMGFSSFFSISLGLMFSCEVEEPSEEPS